MEFQFFSLILTFAFEETNTSVTKYKNKSSFNYKFAFFLNDCKV